jgi:hypothetical protein
MNGIPQHAAKGDQQITTAFLKADLTGFDFFRSCSATLGGLDGVAEFGTGLSS